MPSAQRTVMIQKIGQAVHFIAQRDKAQHIARTNPACIIAQGSYLPPFAQGTKQQTPPF